MKRTFAILALVLATATGLKAQQGGGYNESVVVRGSYNPEIEPSEKLTFPAVITDTLSRIEHAFSYNITPHRLKALYEPARIKAARIVGEPATKLYNNYLRLGMGNYWSPLADLYWSSTRDREKTYGVRINHRSSWGSLPDHGPNHMNQTGVTLFGKYIVADKLQLSTDLGYEHDHNLYYGFSDSTLQAVLGNTRDDISTADYRASYNVASWNIGLRNMQLDPNKLGYSAGLHIDDLWATYGRNQFNMTLAGDIHYGFNLLDQYRGVAYLAATWEGYSYRRLGAKGEPLGYSAAASTDTARANRNIVRLTPYADFMLGGLHFHAGLTTAWDGFSSSDVAFHFYPDVTVSKKLMNDNLVLSLGATGGLDANTLNTLRLVNPYIAPDAEQSATSHYDFTGHARWTLSRKLEANAEVSYSMADNDLIFMLDPAYSLNNVYQTFYLSDNRLTIGADIAFVNDELLTLRAGGHYYSYKYTGLGPFGVRAELYRPDWDAFVRASANYNDKWFFHVEAQLLGKMQADQGEVLPMRYGINAEVEYRHNRALSFFLKMDNLAFQRYYLWANYPSQRGLFVGGLTYTIPHK